jgi:hypothetical protein
MSDLKLALRRYVSMQTPTALPSFGVVAARARRRSHRRVAMVVSVPVLVAAVASGVWASHASQVQSPNRVSAPAAGLTPRGPGSVGSQASAASTQPGTAASRQGALLGNSSDDCVERYGEATLSRRAFAFDGTVTRTTPSSVREGLPGYLSVTFDVRTWFRAGHGASVTLDMFGPMLSSEHSASYSAGTRLLVSGEPRFGSQPLQAPIAWGCGFTRYYDQSTATKWALIF